MNWVIKFLLLICCVIPSCLYVPTPHTPPGSPLCGDPSEINEIFPEALIVIEDACLTFMETTGHDPVDLSHIKIDFLEPEEEWVFCREASLRNENPIFGCANRSQIELKNTERWRKVLAHEIIHVLVYRTENLAGNDPHHIWMSRRDLCYGYCGSYN